MKLLRKLGERKTNSLVTNAEDDEAVNPIALSNMED